MVSGSWLMAHGSMLMARASRQILSWPWAMSHEPGAASLEAWAMSHAPWAMSHEPWAMSHEPLTINNRLIVELFNSKRNFRKITFGNVRDPNKFPLSKFLSFQVSNIQFPKSRSSWIPNLKGSEVSNLLNSQIHLLNFYLPTTPLPTISIIKFRDFQT